MQDPFKSRPPEINPEIARLSSWFLDNWNDGPAKSFPLYKLDLSWPSVGLLDYILYHLRGKTEFSSPEHEIVQGAAAYLAVLTQGYWHLFPDQAGIEVNFCGTAGDIGIFRSGGMFSSSQEKFEVNISQMLRDILAAPPNPFPVMSDFERVIPGEENLVSLAGLGLITSHCPWAKNPPTSASPTPHTGLMAHGYVSSAHKLMAESSAHYYKRNFPGEAIGADPTLYQTGLILPPFGYNEDLIGKSAGLALLTYLQNKGLSRDNMRLTATNLASFPDAQISATGLSLAIALEKPPYTPFIRFATQAKSPLTMYMRPAVLAIRRQLGNPADWVEELDDNNIQTAHELAMADQALGLSPHLVIAPLELSGSPSRPKQQLRHALGWSLIEDALDALLEIAKWRGALNYPLCIQGAYLAYLSQNPEVCHEYLKRAEKLRPDDTPPSDVAAYLLAQLLPGSGKGEEALKMMLSLPQAQPSFGPHLHARCVEYTAATLMNLGRLDEALQHTRLAQDIDPHVLSSKLTTIKILSLLGNNKEAHQILQQLAFLAPVSRRIFNILTIGIG